MVNNVRVKSRPPGMPSNSIQSTGAGERLVRRPFMGFWQNNQDILANASSLAASTAVTSVLGFAFWAYAAHLFSQRAVGFGSAAVSAMTVLGTIGMFGLNTLLIGELPRRESRAGLISAALAAAGLGCMLLGAGFAFVTPFFSSRFVEIIGSPEPAFIFIAGAVLIGVSLVFDQATIGLLRGKLQLWRNAIFAAAKLLILPAVTVVFHAQLGLGITFSWVVGAAVSLAIIALYLRLHGDPVLPRPDWGLLRGLGRLTMIHNWLNLAITVPWMLLPVLVTVTVSPAANAAFYAAWTLSGFLRVVPTHLATVLFAIAAADPQAVAGKLRFSLRISLIIGIPGIAILGLGSHIILNLFGPNYANEATVTLWLLCLGYIPTIPKVHYIAVCRATGHIKRAAVVLTSTATMEVAAAVVGAMLGGLNGLSAALLFGFIVEGLITTPRVWRAASGRGRHRPSRGGGRHRLEGQGRGFSGRRTLQPAVLARDRVSHARAG
jgi:O-antigen/teichoic acid export membrane protein